MTPGLWERAAVQPSIHRRDNTPKTARLHPTYLPSASADERRSASMLLTKKAEDAMVRRLLPDKRCHGPAGVLH